MEAGEAWRSTRTNNTNVPTLSRGQTFKYIVTDSEPSLPPVAESTAFSRRDSFSQTRHCDEDTLMEDDSSTPSGNELFTTPRQFKVNRRILGEADSGGGRDQLIDYQI